MKLLPLLLLLCAVPVQAASLWDATSLAIGGQASFFERGDVAFSRDFEATGNAALSLTPHVSVVGGVAWGIENHYVRAAVGPRITATDANNPTFSIGLGVQYQVVTEEIAGRDEWVGDASVGYRPFSNWRMLLVAQSAYGLESKGMRNSLGVRIPFKVVMGS